MISKKATSDSRRRKLGNYSAKCGQTRGTSLEQLDIGQKLFTKVTESPWKSCNKSDH